MTTATPETELLNGDREAFTFKQWTGPRGKEWTGFDHVLAVDVEHARTKAEARTRLREQRERYLAEYRETSPAWVETALARLDRHKKAYAAAHPRRTK